MKNKKMHLSRALASVALFAGGFLSGPEAHAQIGNLSLGLNYNSGGAVGAPLMNYGPSMGSFGAIGGCANQLGYQGYGGYNPNIPRPPVLVPPQQVGGGYYGAGMVGMPYAPPSTGCGYCQTAAYYAQPPVMGPVQGGPVVYQQAPQVIQQQASSGIYSSGGTTVIDMREQNYDNSGDVIWAAAIGMGMQAPNIYPYVGDRGTYTVTPGLYQTGDRESVLQPRPH